jgi:glutathione S-transferase
MALLVSGTVVELREILLRDKPPEMLAASPKGTVPVLVLPGGDVIDQSLDIMRWALGRRDPEGWLAGDDAGLIAANDGPFKRALDQYKYPNRHGNIDPVDPRATAISLLANLEARLALQPFVHGARPRMTDYALMPFVRQFAATDQAWFDIQALPGVQDWLRRLVNSPLFGSAMLRLARWQPGAIAPLFPAGTSA